MSARSPYLTTAEAATYLRYRSASAIRNLVAAGRLRPAGRRGRTWLFLVSELDASVASHGASVAPAIPGIEALPDGRKRIRLRAMDPRTGRMKEVDRVVEATVETH